MLFSKSVALALLVKESLCSVFSLGELIFTLSKDSSLNVVSLILIGDSGITSVSIFSGTMSG